jgi:DNA-binding CsgD family transcriptional regulator
VLYIPGCILLALGLIFLLNVITNDWNSWAYAWLLILSGLGLGLTLASRSLSWRKQFSQAGIGLVVVGTSLFAIFGVIAGGLVIQIMAPVLLILGGLALRWLRPEHLLPEGAPIQPAQAVPTPATPAAIANGNQGKIPGQASPAEPGSLVEPLSERELQVLKMIDQGFSNQEIAARLVLAQSTVKTHINNIYGKLGVQTRVQAVNRARDLALFDH